MLQEKIFNGEKLRNIIIVDCKSTGLNFIKDIVNRGYNPVVLELQWHNDDVEEYKEAMEKGYATVDEKFDMIYERDSYEETLETVKKWDPLLVLPGNEHGVILATKLANDLDLLCNPIENMDYFTLKDKMHERLAEAGLRHIKGKTVRSLEEALEFYDSEGLEEVVVKPVYSAFSVGIHLCLNRQEMIDAINEVFETYNCYGEKNDEIVIQERIKGEEYIVNTVSCDGIHRLTLVWKYNKLNTSEGAIVYDIVKTIDNFDIGEAEMVEYAYNVADALGIKYGPVHGEYMIDEKGPVLIEVNCRPCGASMPALFLDRISGQHETDSILDAYLKPKRFHNKRKEKYRLLAHGALKIFIVPEDIWANSAPILNISPLLKSYYGNNLVNDYEDQMFYVKTHDLETSCGFVYLVNDDPSVLKADLAFLRNLEKHAFSLVLSDKNPVDMEVDEDRIMSEIKKIVDITEDYGTGLLMTDQFIGNGDIVQLGLDDLDGINSEFDYVIVNLNKSLLSKKDDEIVKIILNIFSKVRIGGIVCVPPSTFDYVPGKRNGIEALMKAMNLRIEAYPHGMNAGVVASREQM